MAHVIQLIFVHNLLCQQLFSNISLPPITAPHLGEEEVNVRSLVDKESDWMVLNLDPHNEVGRSGRSEGHGGAGGGHR